MFCWPWRLFCCMRYPETLSKIQCHLVSSSCVVLLSRPLNRFTRWSQVAHSSSMGAPHGTTVPCLFPLGSTIP